MSERPLPIADALEQAAARMQQRIATAYQRVACPRCTAAAGQRCMRVHRQRPMRDSPLKHSHKERLRADGINLR